MDPPEQYPFLFYGIRPRSWHESVTSPGSYFYEMLFKELPGADLKVALGRSWQARTGGGAVEGDEWLWCGRWALVRVAKNPLSRFQDFFTEMIELFIGVHAIAPLSEVVFWGANDLFKDPWDEWTLARQAIPSAGPVYARLDPPSFFNQPRDPSLGTPARDADFDRGCAGATPVADPVDARPAIDLGDAVARVDSFLHGYTTHPDYFEDGWPILIVLLVSANDEDTGVEVIFSCEGPANSKLEALCEKAIAALEQAYPNLGFPLTWDLSSG